MTNNFSYTYVCIDHFFTITTNREYVLPHVVCQFYAPSKMSSNRDTRYIFKVMMKRILNQSAKKFLLM